MASLRQVFHRPEHGPGHPGLGVRSHVALHHAELDRDLAAGVPAAASPAHAERARQLMGRHLRRELAGRIDGVVARAEHPPHWHSTALPIEAAAVLAARNDLDRLRAELLTEHCAARGVALASVLLYDDRSPLFTASADATVGALAQSATAALTGETDDALAAG
jgi:MoxR-like ATPase